MKKKRSKEKIERKQEEDVQGWKVYYEKEISALLKKNWRGKLIEHTKEVEVPIIL